MATTVIDSEYLAEADDLPELLAAMHQLARLIELTIRGRIHERDVGGVQPQDGDEELILGLVWPLEAACGQAVKLERTTRPDRAPEPPGDGKLAILDGGRA
jgi:hypothetical protein